tara:strand:- start:490 stop:1152 length:663 start_codon:yes stop_codon:yes gene_type:complete
MADRFPLIVNSSSLRIQEIADSDNLDLSGVGIKSAGDTSVNSLKIRVGTGETTVITSGRALQNITSIDATTTAAIETAITGSPNNLDDLNVTGIATIGSSTGLGTMTVGLGTTAVYISGGQGARALDVDGNAIITGITTFGTSSVKIDGTANSINIGTGTTIISGQVSVATSMTVGVSTIFPDYIQTGIGSVGSNAQGNKTVSTSAPSGGNDGDVWYRYS